MKNKSCMILLFFINLLILPVYGLNFLSDKNEIYIKDTLMKNQNVQSIVKFLHDVDLHERWNVELLMKDGTIIKLEQVKIKNDEIVFSRLIRLGKYGSPFRFHKYSDDLWGTEWSLFTYPSNEIVNNLAENQRVDYLLANYKIIESVYDKLPSIGKEFNNLLKEKKYKEAGKLIGVDIDNPPVHDVWIVELYDECTTLCW